jgi:hypothetical protein
MAKGKGLRFVGGALFLGILLLFAVACAVGSNVVEGLEQKTVNQDNAHTTAVRAAATEAGGPDPKPAEATEVEPSKGCTGDACLYVASTPGAAVPHPGDGYSMSNCGPLSMAHKEGVKADCSLATMSHAIAGLCARKKGNEGGWCPMAADEQDAWIPLPSNIDARGLSAMATPVKDGKSITV